MMTKAIFLRMEHQVRRLRHVLSRVHTNKFSLPDLVYPVTPTSPLHDRPFSLPGALPHLMDALYADLDSVTRLLETRSPSARDLNDITHMIKVAAAFRERLQQAGPGRPDFAPIPSPAFHSSRGPIYTPTSPPRTPCYPQDPHFPLDAHARAYSRDFHGGMAVLPPAPNSPAPDPGSARRAPKHATFLNMVFRPLIALVGPTKGRTLAPSCHCLELSGGHSHP